MKFAYRRACGKYSVLAYSQIKLFGRLHLWDSNKPCENDAKKKNTLKLVENKKIIAVSKKCHADDTLQARMSSHP